MNLAILQIKELNIADVYYQKYQVALALNYFHIFS